MTQTATETKPAPACEGCLRRSWLLCRLSAALDYRCGEVPRLLDLLALDDGQLMLALAGSRHKMLEARYARFDPRELAAASGVETACRHERVYPPALGDPGGPRMLNVLGGAGRLCELAGGPVVALVGTRAASDYGMEMAKSLARGLAASGVTVVSGLADGVSVAAHSGVLEVDAASVAVMNGGADVACPSRMRSLLARLITRGCAVSELPGGCEGRRWGAVAGERIVARLADVTVVVEAHECPRELAAAAIARVTGGTVAALPGRVTSPASHGANALLMGGAALVRGAQDVLELLHDAPARAPFGERDRRLELEPRLLDVLERVGAGRDTPGKLIDADRDAGEVLLALTELELMGVLARGDGGRYVPRDFRGPAARPENQCNGRTPTPKRVTRHDGERDTGRTDVGGASDIRSG